MSVPIFEYPDLEIDESFFKFMKIYVYFLFTLKYTVYPHKHNLADGCNTLFNIMSGLAEIPWIQFWIFGFDETWLPEVQTSKLRDCGSHSNSLTQKNPSFKGETLLASLRNRWRKLGSLCVGQETVEDNEQSAADSIFQTERSWMCLPFEGIALAVSVVAYWLPQSISSSEVFDPMRLTGWLFVGRSRWTGKGKGSGLQSVDIGVRTQNPPRLRVVQREEHRIFRVSVISMCRATTTQPPVRYHRALSSREP